MDKLISILQGINSDIDYKNENALFTSGKMTSLDMIRLVLAVNSEFGIEIDPDDITTENFDSVQTMMKLIDKYRTAKRV